MLRQKTPSGYHLITHPDHAHLAGHFAEHWGNELFRPPEPRTSVLCGIHAHDNGWLQRDASPLVTRQGRPSAFSAELVGKYSAFEEIDLAQYLAVREAAMLELEQADPYAALIVSMHTYNLLTERADRASIAAPELPMLDDFLNRQRLRQQALHKALVTNSSFTPQEVTSGAIFNSFRLLQACDNLSLLSCVSFSRPATLLHPLPTVEGASEVHVLPIGPRSFRLEPYPFDEPQLTFRVPARHVEGELFDSSETLASAYIHSPVEQLEIHLSS